MNHLRGLVIVFALFSTSLSAQTNGLPQGYEEVMKSASAGKWSQVWVELERVGVLVVEVWDLLMSEAIRQDNDVVLGELVQRARAAEIIEESTQFSVCPVSPHSAPPFSESRPLTGGIEQVEFDPSALTPIEPIEVVNTLDTDNADHIPQRAVLLDDIATVLNFDALN